MPVDNQLHANSSPGCGPKSTEYPESHWVVTGFIGCVEDLVLGGFNQFQTVEQRSRVVAEQPDALGVQTAVLLAEA
jgi:hypothetical protein